MGSAEWARRINTREWGPEERYLNLDAFWLHPKPLPHGKHGKAKAADVSPNGGGGWVDVRGASPNDLELSSVRFACWHPYITHLKDEDGFFYLYKNLNACVPSRRCLSGSGSIHLYKNLNACGKPPQGGTESTGTTCQGSKHLDFYINKKPPQGGTESTGDNLPGMEAFRFLYK